MQDVDRGFKEVARLAGRQLARMARIHSDGWEPITSEIQMTERFADRAFRARRGNERFVVYFEAFTRWERRAPRNLLTKARLLSEREELPTQTVVFVLQRRGYRPQGGQFLLEVAGEPTQQLWFREVLLWEQEPEPWWEEVPALMPLYPLCRHGKRPRAGVIHAASVIRERIPSPLDQNDALFLLSIFSNLAYRGLDIESIIGSEIMMASRIGQKLWNLGELDHARAAVLRVLQARFDDLVVETVTRTLAEIEELGQLDQLLSHAATCTNWRRLLADLSPARPQTPTRRVRGRRGQDT